MVRKDDKQLPLFEVSPDKLKTGAESSADKVASSPFSQYIVYVDESGDHSLQSIDAQYPVFNQWGQTRLIPIGSSPWRYKAYSVVEQASLGFLRDFLRMSTL